MMRVSAGFLALQIRVVRNQLDVTSVSLICQNNPLRLGSPTLRIPTSHRSKNRGTIKIP